MWFQALMRTVKTSWRTWKSNENVFILFRDYQAKDALDKYESQGIDDEEEQKELNYQQRREIEKKMDQEQRVQKIKAKRMPGAFIDDDEYSDQDDNVARQMRLDRFRELREDGGMNSHDDPDGLQNVLDYEDYKGQLSSWIQRTEVIRWIRKSFSTFLRTFKDENTYSSVYEERIRDMCSQNRQSLEITFIHLSKMYPTLAIWLAEEPSLMLPILNEVCFEVTLELFSEYHMIHDTIYARIKDLPVEDKLRDLRQIHLNALIKIRGVATKRTGVFPECSKIYFRCSCGDLKGPIFHNSIQEAKQYLGQCIVC